MIGTGYNAFAPETFAPEAGAPDTAAFSIPADAAAPPPPAAEAPVTVAGVVPADSPAKACLDDITALRNIKARMDRLAEELARSDLPHDKRTTNNLLNAIQREAAEGEKLCARIQQNCANLGIPASEMGNVHNLCDRIRTMGRAAQEQQDAMNKGLNFDLGAVTDAIGDVGGAIAGAVLMILSFLFGGRAQSAY